MLVQNKFEGYRAGIGLNTNEKLSDVFSIGGFVGYGLRDHLWKNGLNLKIKVSKNHEIELNGNLFNTLNEAGHSDLSSFSLEQYGFRQYMTSRLTPLKLHSTSTRVWRRHIAGSATPIPTRVGLTRQSNSSRLPSA